MVAPPPPAPAPSPKPEPEPAAASAPAQASPAPAKPARARPPKVPTDVPPRPAPVGRAAAPAAGSGQGQGELAEGQLAGAGTAESGEGGGACNMTRRLQVALRKDRLVQSAVGQAYRGRALLIWNGAWVRHDGEDGAGLATLRESLMWDIAFAPRECREEAVHGLVLISLGEGPGAPRLALGEGDWRWSDLLRHP